MILTVSTTTLDRALLQLDCDLSQWPKYDRYTPNEVRCVMSRKLFPISNIQLDEQATWEELKRQIAAPTINHALAVVNNSYQHWAMTFPNEDDAVWWRLKYG